MDMLFRRASAEDSMTRELVAATLCNISVDAEARQPMIAMGVVQVRVMGGPASLDHPYSHV